MEGKVRELLQLPTISANHIREVGAILFALRRLQRSTPGFAAGLDVVDSMNNESRWCGFFISETEFRIGTGYSTYAPGVGGDHQSETIFEMDTSGFRCGAGRDSDVLDWFNEFDQLLAMGGKIQIEYLGEDDQVDWSEDGSEEFWNELDEHE